MIERRTAAYGSLTNDPVRIEALLFLAEWAKQRQQYSDAEQYCNALLDIGGPTKEQAKSLLLEIQSLSQSGASPSAGALNFFNGVHIHEDDSDQPIARTSAASGGTLSSAAAAAVQQTPVALYPTSANSSASASASQLRS